MSGVVVILFPYMGAGDMECTVYKIHWALYLHAQLSACVLYFRDVFKIWLLQQLYTWTLLTQWDYALPKGITNARPSSGTPAPLTQTNLTASAPYFLLLWLPPSNKVGAGHLLGKKVSGETQKGLCHFAHGSSAKYDLPPPLHEEAPPPP